jgi:hypothetical protein
LYGRNLKKWYPETLDFLHAESPFAVIGGAFPAASRASKRPRRMTGARIQSLPRWRYLVGVDTVVNVVASLVPSPCMTAMMDMEMPAAMSPYSTAVAPDSSLTNFTRIVILQRLQSVLAAGKLPPVLLWLSRCGGRADRIEPPLRGG